MYKTHMRKISIRDSTLIIQNRTFLTVGPCVKYTATLRSKMYYPEVHVFTYGVDIRSALQ